MEQRADAVLSVEKMTMKDLDEVMEVERQCFTTPWSRYSFVCELKDNQFSHYIVAKYMGKIIGYAGMWIILDEAHVTNVGVLPEYRGGGVGELLMRSLIIAAKEHGAKKMTLEVRKSNYVAQNLYSKLGFEPVGIRRGYYLDNREDAVIMWKDSL
ncbi:MAG TPA: ribosomal protein S18-alanine N-acetyltransferase [Thermoanaerobacterales bacterium]|uniref:ribosomal protein S18-alanine N-acetyltransferase n=1 Tax=Tepidanaerobacter sp. GT38 TaxID=2722793 RepID=UPI00181C72B6|nr:ribosomal protein S18-alanine N-acetyltransferase [Tepidanaerobacter sp. GT38]MCG1011441.1 ribosomal protein S18-alanine N-acetyltransferase [Tepidanaerobacter sp. GT38]HHY41259.1 ribosomal protein S18-alanine N-acetyltransferase [Thermoanaerobacterales bacterium]